MSARPKLFPVVYASAFEPCGDRTRWMIVTAACPFDGGRHQHYASTLEQAGGAKRAGCRRGVYVVTVVRVYRLRQAEEAAA